MSGFLLQLRWNGRFGNRMFQHAYGATYARLTGLAYWLPSEWEGTRLFRQQDHRVVENDEIRLALAPPDDEYVRNHLKMQAVQKHYPDAELIDTEVAPDPYIAPGHPLCHANGCMYNKAIFARMSKGHLRSLYQFSDEVTRLESYRRYFDMQGLYDVAHLRRDDTSDVEYNRTHPQGHSVISKDSYLRAFRKFGYSEDSIEWVSDDYSGRWHIGRKVRFRGGWEYPAGSQYLPGIVFDWLDDFLKLYFARTIFRANSSFSWWAATLSPTANVFSPVIDKSHIYGVDGMEEIAVDFVEGNHPHWLHGGRYDKPDIVLGE
jgi:hypothetical protein